MDTRRIPADSRYLKTPDGAVYGPVDALTLCAWAADARVTPGCQVSRDGLAWKDATEYPELRLHWQASLPDGTAVGPLNLFALWELIQDGSLPRGLLVRHRLTGEEVPLDERLLPVALKESRDLIQVMARQMAGAMAPAAAPEAEALKARLAQAEKDLAENLRLMGETQRLLLARDRQIKALEERGEQGEARLAALRREIEAGRAGAAAPVTKAAAATARPAALEQELAAVRQQRDAAQQAAAGRERETLALKAKLAESVERLAAEQRDTETRLAAGDTALRGVQDALARTQAGAAALRESSERSAAAWETERAALVRRCDEAEAAAQSRGEAAEASAARVRAAEADAQTAARQLEAERASALEQRREWERRLAEAGQVAEALQAEADARQAEAAAQAQAERRLLEQRLEAADRAREARAAECERLRAGMAAATAEKDQAGSRIADLERGLREAASAREADLQHLAGIEQAGREALAREITARQAAEAGAASGRERLAELEAAAQRLAGDKTDTEATLSRERDALQARVAEREASLAEAQREITIRENRLAELDTAHMAALVAAGQNEAGLRERNSRLERELEQTIRRLNEAKSEATALRQSLTDERSRSVETAKRLQVELKSVQRDLHAMNMVNLAARQIRADKPSAAAGSAIDWLSVSSTPAPAAPTAKEPVDKFAGLDLYDQVGVLHEELKSSIGAKELLRLELEKLRKAHEDLQRRAEDSDRTLNGKVAQLQNEIQSSGAVLHQTMEELERREAAWRLARKKAEEREKELADRVAALQAEAAKKAESPPVVIQGEWQMPPKASPPPPPAAEPASAAPAVLGNVEARLQTELHKWDSLNRDKDRKADKTRSWFRWKQP